MSEEGFATPQEVALALVAMSPADQRRLYKLARLRNRGLSSIGWEDLVQEAITRALQGRRRWPRSVPFIAFLAQTLRSVASEEWQRLGAMEVKVNSDLGKVEGDGSTIAEVGQDLISPERRVLALRTLEEIDALFVGDEHARGLLKGLGEGASPLEIQASVGMDQKQYETTQKRIRRKLSRFLSPEEN